MNITYAPNPNYSGQRNVLPTIRVVVCVCDSTNVEKTYLMTGEDVTGVRHTCRDCGAVA